MKRLKSMIGGLLPNNYTYKELYDGRIYMYSDLSEEWPWEESDPVYWRNEIFYEITRSNKLQTDLPTIKIGIPTKMLGINMPKDRHSIETTILRDTIVEADFCLRSFIPFIDKLNEDNYNRTRPDKENGKYIIYHPGHKVLLRNCAYFCETTPQPYVLLKAGEGKMLPAQETESYLCIMIQMQQQMRQELEKLGLVAFIADGSVLPREKGGEEPLLEAVLFQAPEAERMMLCGKPGLGIKKGVTVITEGSAVKISAEDGRSATNFMIQDRVMKELIQNEPITPFTDRVRELFLKEGVSTILVIGGSSEADTVYMMNDYMIENGTEKSKRLLLERGGSGVNSELQPTSWDSRRRVRKDSLTSFPKDSGTELLKISDLGFLLMGDERVDVRRIHNISSSGQLNAIAFMLRRMAAEVSGIGKRAFLKDLHLNGKADTGSEINAGVTDVEDSTMDAETAVEDLISLVKEKGLDYVFSTFFTECERFMELPRKSEILAVMHRMKGVENI